MTHWIAAAPSILASFMASMVEFVEALTIVLAVGIVRGWRSALLGAAAALALLVMMVLVLGPSLARIPLHWVQLVVGTLVLLFGLRWLRKAILRAAGVLPLHDEAKAFADQSRAMQQEGDSEPEAVDKIAFMTVFKSVLLEGLEVVFIVIAIGSSGRLLVPAAAGAALALVVVALLGLWLHRPLATVPENALKFGVGVMLGAFGTFWVGEGIGIEWPGADWALLLMFGAFLIVALGLVTICRRLGPRARRPQEDAAGALLTSFPAPARKGGILASAAAELAGLFIDDGLLSLGIVSWVVLLWLTLGVLPSIALSAAGAILAAGLAGVLALSALRRARA